MFSNTASKDKYFNVNSVQLKANVNMVKLEFY